MREAEEAALPGKGSLQGLEPSGAEKEPGREGRREDPAPQIEFMYPALPSSRSEDKVGDDTKVQSQAGWERTGEGRQVAATSLN